MRSPKRWSSSSRWLAQEQDEAGDWPGLDALAPARSRKSRHGAILLPFRALLAAIEAARMTTPAETARRPPRSSKAARSCSARRWCSSRCSAG